jgi:hypothetical protein
MDEINVSIGKKEKRKKKKKCFSRKNSQLAAVSTILARGNERERARSFV